MISAQTEGGSEKMIFAQTLMIVQIIELYRKIGRGGASMESLPVVISASPSFEMEANEAPSVINSFILVSLVLSCNP